MRHALAVTLALGLAPGAFAEERTLQTLPADKLEAMGPMLRHGEVALIESTREGRQKQVTIMALVAAPPELVHDIFVRPEDYPKFVRNMDKSQVTRRPDGTLVQDFQIGYTLTHFEATYLYKPHPDGSVDVEAIDPNDDGVFRWEFYRVPGGTVLVMYGYTDVLHSNGFVHSIIDRMPSMEHGMAVTAQLAYVRAIKAEAERRAKPGSFPPLDAKAKAPGFDFLLKRGKVAVIRSDRDGRLSDVSIVDRIWAPRAKVEAALLSPADYVKFIEGLKMSKEIARTATAITYETDSDVPLFGWDSTFELHSDGRGGIDALGVRGDLRGAHYRWDLTGSGEATLAVFRAVQDVAAASPIVCGALLHAEPLFEHGINVALGLVQVIGVRGRAEGWR